MEEDIIFRKGKMPVINKGVTTNEIPDAIAVFFEIGNCWCRCEGCHSPELWDSNHSKGTMTYEQILDYIYRQITIGANAVVFMGGLDNVGVFPHDFVKFVKCLHSLGIRVGLYTGRNKNNINYGAMKEIQKYLTWFKVGEYDEFYGGLDKPQTNQVFYKKNKFGKWEDITSIFQRKEK